MALTNSLAQKLSRDCVCSLYGFAAEQNGFYINPNPKAIHNPKQSDSCFTSLSRDQNREHIYREAFIIIPYV